MMAIVSPLPTPRAASPAARPRVRSEYSPQLMLTSPSFVRRAGRSGWASAVCWNASHIVRASKATGFSVRRSAAVVSIRALPRLACPRLSPLEPLTGQSVDVVGQPQDEEPDHEHEAHHPRALHDAERDRLPA